MAGTREIITLQFGHYSNFVGTHVWNIQENSFVYDPKAAKGPKELNHDVLFREGLTLQGEVTYTPRLVAFDLKGSLNTLKQEGTLYDLQCAEDKLQWPSDVTLHQVGVPQKNAFLRDLDRQQEEYLRGKSEESSQGDEEKTTEEMDTGEGTSSEDSPQVFGPAKLYNLDDSVKVWSDFLKPHLHPRSVTILRDYEHESECNPFNVYGQGKQVLTNKRFRDEIEDRIHFFTEECDHLQGFNILADTYNGFGGFTSSILEEIADDYSNKGILSFGLMPAVLQNSSATEESYQLINSALSWEQLAHHSSLFVPLSLNKTPFDTSIAVQQFDHLNYNSSLHYHTSAILGACLDTLTLPFRLDTSPVAMTDVTDILSFQGRKVASLGVSLPFPLSENGSLANTLMAAGDMSPWKPVTPYSDNTTLPFAQTIVGRGVLPDKVQGTIDPNAPKLLKDCSTADEVLGLYLAEMFPNCISSVKVLQSPCQVTAPYPHMFSRNINSDGYVSQKNRSDSMGVNSVPVMTSLQSTPTSAKCVQALLKETKKLNISKYNKFLEAGLEQDDYKECLNSLETLQENYVVDMSFS